MSRCSVAILLILCSSCASLPTRDDIEKFSTATTNGAEAAETAVGSSNLIAERIDRQIESDNFIRSRSFSVSTVPETVVRLSPEQVGLRTAALKDLKAYAMALSTSADQGTIDELEAAALALGNSAANLAMVVPTAGPVVAPALKLTGRAAGYALADRYVRQVLDVIQRTDPTVQTLVTLLADDLELLSGQILGNAVIYSARRREQLALIGSDKRLTYAERRSEYVAAEQDIDAQFALSKASADIKASIEAIGEAHRLLAVGTPNVSVAIGRISALAADAGEVMKAASLEAER